MKALISGQAGIAIVIDGGNASVVRIERPGDPELFRSDDVSQLLADAQDVAEFEATDQTEILARLSQAWKQDRALQMMKMISDTTPNSDIRQRACALLDSAMQDPEVTRFLRNRLYASPFADDAEPLNRSWLADTHHLLPLLEELKLHQYAINVSRGAWNSLTPALFLGLVKRNDPQASGMELAAKAKDALEITLVDTGIFRLLARSIHERVPPIQNQDILSALQDPKFLVYRSILLKTLREWVKASETRSQALLRVQLLGDVSLLRLKKYAKVLIDWLDEKSYGRSHWDLLRDAAVRALAEHKQPQEDINFEMHVQKAIGEVASEWYTGPPGNQTKYRTQIEIWEAVGLLSEGELLKLKKFAKWRIKGLGRKAHGRDDKDLLDEAITATVTQERIWNERVDLCSHLMGAMRSISSRWRDKKGEEYLESELSSPTGIGPFDQASASPDPERIFQGKETLDQVRRLFSQDAAGASVLDLLGEGFSPQEIQSILTLTTQQFDTIARRIRRRLDAWQDQQGAA